MTQMELAEIFGVTVDKLIGEKSVPVDAALNDKLEECMKNQGTLAEDVSAVLPILKPNQVKTVVSNAERFDWKAIQGLLPFMKELAVKALKGSLTK